MRSRNGIYLQAALWAFLTGVLLLWPSLPSAESAPAWTAALVHFVLFAVLAPLVVRSLRAAGRRRPFSSGFFLAWGYGGLLELLQLLVEGRTTEWRDVWMNGLGALAGVACARVFESLRYRRGPWGPSTPGER